MLKSNKKPLKTPKHNPSWVIIGKIGRPIGLEGNLSFHTYSNVPDVDDFYIFEEEWEKIDIKFIPGNKPLIKAKDVLTPEATRKLVNKFISVKRSDLPDLPEDEFYWHDLIQLSVYNQNNEYLGIVTEVKDFGAQANLIVEINKQINIIPLLKGIIIKTDVTNKKIIVDWDYT